MQAPGYVETNPSTIRYREYTLQLHKRKLKEIQQQSTGRLTAPQGEMSKYLKAKPQPYHEMGKFHAERHAVIKRENQLLLDKLVEISQGKRPVNSSNVSKILSAPQPKSLNINYRKKEAVRIAAENEALARRLMEKSPHLSKRRLDMQYENAVKYKKQISKSYLFRRRAKSKMSLPPIEESKRNSPDKYTGSGHRRHRSKKSLSPKEKVRNRSVNLNERPKEKSARSARSKLHPNKMSLDFDAKNGAKSHESLKGFDYLNTERPGNEEFKYEVLNIGSQTERISIKTRESFREYNEEGGHQQYVEDDYEDSFEDYEETQRTGENGSEERASQTSSKESSLYRKRQQSSSRGSLMRANSGDNMQHEMIKPTEEHAENPEEYKLEVITDAQLDKIQSADEDGSKAQTPSMLENKPDIEVPMAESSKSKRMLSISIHKDLDSSVESDYMNRSRKSVQRVETEQVITEDPSYLHGRFDESSRVSSKKPSFSNIQDTPKLHKKLSRQSKYEEYDEDFESDVEESYHLPARNPKTSTGEYEIILHSDRSDADISEAEHARQASYNPRVIESPEEHEESSQDSDVSKSDAEIEISQQSHRSILKDSKQESIRQSSSLYQKSIENSDIESSVHIPKPLSRASKQEYENPIFSAHSSRRSSRPVSVKNSRDQEDSVYSSKAEEEASKRSIAEIENHSAKSSRKSSKPVSVKNSRDQEDSVYSSKAEEEASKSSIAEIENHSAKSSRRSSRPVSVRNSRDQEDSIYSSKAEEEASKRSIAEIENHSAKSSRKSSREYNKDSLKQSQTDIEQERSVNHSSRRSSKPVSVKSSIDYEPAPVNKSKTKLSSKNLSGSVSQEKIELSNLNGIHNKSYQSAIQSPHLNHSKNSSTISNLKASYLSINEASPAADEPSFLSESKPLSAKSLAESCQDFLSHPSSPIHPTNLQEKFMDSSLLQESHRSDKLSISAEEEV
jgi:hypothetical protein